MQNEPCIPHRARSALATGLWAIGMTAATARNAWPIGLSSQPVAQPERDRASSEACVAPRLRWRGLFSRCPA